MIEESSSKRKMVHEQPILASLILFLIGSFMSVIGAYRTLKAERHYLGKGLGAPIENRKPVEIPRWSGVSQGLTGSALLFSFTMNFSFPSSALSPGIFWLFATLGACTSILHIVGAAHCIASRVSPDWRSTALGRLITGVFHGALVFIIVRNTLL